MPHEMLVNTACHTSAHICNVIHYSALLLNDFMYMGVLPMDVYMYMYHVPAGALQRLELEKVVSSHVGARHQAWVLFQSTQCS